MQFFLDEGGSCSYEDETIGDIEVPLRYKHIVKQLLPKDLPQLNTNFCVNERIYRIVPSSLHYLGLFCMDGIKVGYNRYTKLMEYVRPCYKYKYWMCLVQYIRSMHIYGLSRKYLQLKDKHQSKGAMLYIDGRPKAIGNIEGFINSTQPGSTIKQPNCIFERHEGNHFFVCSFKSIDIREEFLITYNLNQVDKNTVTMGVAHLANYPTFY